MGLHLLPLRARARALLRLGLGDCERLGHGGGVDKKGAEKVPVGRERAQVPRQVVGRVARHEPLQPAGNRERHAAHAACQRYATRTRTHAYHCMQEWAEKGREKANDEQGKQTKAGIGRACVPFLNAGGLRLCMHTHLETQTRARQRASADLNPSSTAWVFWETGKVPAGATRRRP